MVMRQKKGQPLRLGLHIRKTGGPENKTGVERLESF
jgi:hypothetical protein